MLAVLLKIAPGAISAGRGQRVGKGTDCYLMWRTTVVHGGLVMKVEISMNKNRELVAVVVVGVLDDVVDGVKEIGDKMKQGYPGLKIVV